MKKTIKLSGNYILWTMLLLSILLASQSQAAYQALQLISPKASGTGSPPIPANHRIFYAYPGIEYKIRAQVVGGDYPYSYQLSNSPAGMTVDASGYIRWPNPQTSVNNIGLRVTDSNGVHVDSTWSISVQTASFKFVDANAGTNGTGTLASPFNSISNMVAGASSTDIIYFRTGTYPVPARGGNTIGSASAFQWNSPSDTATRWLAYPGEEAVIDLTSNRYFLGETSVPFYFEGLTFSRGREYFFRASSTSTYVTFLDNTFDTLTLERTNYNSNQGTYFTVHGGTGFFLTFQGNVFSGYRGTQGIGSLYDQNTILVENNHFSDFTDSNSANQVLAFKVGIVNLTLRGNVINLSASDNFGIMGGSTNGMFADGTSSGHGPKSENIEILYNYFRHDGSGGIDFNRYDDQGTTWVYRNTFVSNMQMTNLSNTDCDGPWFFENNVFQNSASGISYHYSCSAGGSCINQSGNLGETSGIVDSDGLLTSGYNTYAGEVGWQFPDVSTPIDGIYITDTKPDSTVVPNAPQGFMLQIPTN